MCWVGGGSRLRSVPGVSRDKGAVGAGAEPSAQRCPPGRGVRVRGARSRGGERRLSVSFPRKLGAGLERGAEPRVVLGLGLCARRSELRVLLSGAGRSAPVASDLCVFCGMVFPKSRKRAEIGASFCSG